MDNYIFVLTPQQKNHHSEFYKYIESFPHLPIKRTEAELKQDIHTTIKSQFSFLQKDNAKRQLRIRECLKQNTRDYMQFCLDHKLAGLSVEDAAKEAGVYKSIKVSRHNNEKHLAKAQEAHH